MNHIWSIAAKELRGYFNSAVALIFLATFLAVVLFTFFWVDKFFARGLADVRPLFEWLPLLLIFLVAALTMRLWSEEQKTGTLEILLTLPVPVHRLVLGKFLAGFILVAIALGLTLGLPITVDNFGELDWGPVMGGYLAALLMAGTYLAIGLCVSSTTENQIVALIVTAAVCFFLYLPGTDDVASFFGLEWGDVLRRIGTGSRFDSIARGVLDLRDLVYYGSLIAVFLALNVVILQAKRWGAGARTQGNRLNATLAVILIAANALALNIWLTPVAAARADLTRGGQYSLSEATEDLLTSLDEPLVIRGYFSADTHPLLAPLVPQIRDLLDEYQVEGGSNVRVSFLDPSKDEEVEKEAREVYNVTSLPLEFSSRHEQAIRNVFFHVLVAYGDQHEVLSLEQLIEVEAIDINDVQVKLGNIEYEITRAIRKAALEFQSVDSLFASIAGKMTLEAYITPDSLPPELAEVTKRLESVVEEFTAKSGGKFEYTQTAPDSEELQRKLYQQYGIQPMSVSFLGQDYFYFHLLLKGIGDKPMLIRISEDTSEVELRDLLTQALERAAPGFIKVVGMVTPPQGPPQPNRMQPQAPPQPTPPAQQFRNLTERLRQNYQVQSVSLDSGVVPDEIDVLLLAGPEKLEAEAQKAVDQFLMRGGAIIVLAGKYRLQPRSRELAVEQVETGLDELLAKWGVELGGELVLDEQNDSFPIPVVRNLGGLQVRDIQRVAYPFFVKVPRSGMEEGGVATSGLGPTTLHWATPVTFKDPGDGKDGEDGEDGEDGKDGKDGKDGEDELKVDKQVLLKSSKDSWLQSTTDVLPNFDRYPETGFGKPEDAKAGPHPLVVALTGTFRSAITEELRKKAQESGEGADAPERLLERSTPDARLVVVGSSSLVADTVLSLASQTRSRDIENNIQLIQNLIDWSLEDTALLSIRARTSAATLELPEDERSTWHIINYVIALLGLGLVIGASHVIRRPTIELGKLGSGGRNRKERARLAARDDDDSDDDDDDDDDDEETA